MIKRIPEGPRPATPLFYTQYFYALCCLSGFIATVAAFLLLTYARHNEHLGKTKDFCLHGLVSAKETMRISWEQAEYWADQMARQIGTEKKESISTMLAGYQSLWPNVGFSLFDGNAALITDFASDSANQNRGGNIADLPGLQAMVLKALDGEHFRDYTISRGFLSLGVAVPVQGKQVRAIVLSVPLDPFYLRYAKPPASASLAVALLDESGTSILGDIISLSDAFKKSDTAPLNLRQNLDALLKQSRLKEGAPFLLQDGDFSAGLELLVSSNGTPMGLLLASPPHKAPPGYPVWHVYASVAFGILMALLLGLLLRFREKRMAVAVAADMNGLVRDMEAEPQHNWPPALDGAFRKIAESLEEYRDLLENSLAEQSERRDTAKQDRDSAGADRSEHQRLFDSLPIGAFRAAIDGHFLQVNSAFAMLLGYESPMNFVAECGSFQNICLYGEGLHNPLGLIAEKGPGRHVLSLRRRDGQASHFAVICMALTTATGEDSGIIEGFLLDRGLEDKLSAVERDNLYAQQERESLARLLAATCLQTRNFFQPPPERLRHRDNKAGSAASAPAKDTLPAQAPAAQWPEFRMISGQMGTTTSQEEEEDRLERRKSMLSIKAVLSDIYQIAMSEAEGSPPLPVPMELFHFLRQLCRQALPALFAKGISLRCEIADDLPLRMNGPEPVLRHALLRSLLAVTGPVTGGWACLNIMQDPGVSPTTGVARLLISLSWSPSGGIPEVAHSNEDATDTFMHIPDRGFTVFVAEAPDGAHLPDGKKFNMIPDLGVEQDVIRFLSRKMRGTLVESVFTDRLRSMQLAIPLNHLCDVSDGCRTVAWEKSPDGTVDLAPSTQTANGHVAETEEPQTVEIRRVEPKPAATDLSQDLAGALELGEEAAASIQPPNFNLLVVDPDAKVDESGQARAFSENGILAGDNAVAMRSLDILLVDASLNHRMIFSMYLKDVSHRITEAHDGQAGVEAYQRGRFDIVFMDMEMPLMDGHRATRIIRALEADKALPPTPIVGMTSYALPELRRECMLSGCTEFLSRPFSKNALLTLIQAFAGLKDESDGAPSS